MKKLICLSVGLLVALLVPSASFAAEKWTAEKVIQEVIASYEKQMEKVNDVTTITDKYTLYQKRAKVKGENLYKSRMEMEVMGEKYISIYDGIYEWSKYPSGKVTKEKISFDPYQTWKNLASADTKYKGTEEIDKLNCHVLTIDDMSKILSLREYETEATGEVSGKTWIDAKDWVIRKMEIVVKIEEEEGGEEITVKQIHKMGDYRKVDGMLVAYRRAVITIIGAEELTPEKRKETKEGLRKMQEQLEKMPPAQREMLEGIIKPQMETMKKLLGEEEVTIVKKVEINTGLSDSLFDGSKLKPKKAQ